MIPLASHRCPSSPYHLWMRSNRRSYFLPLKPVEVLPPLLRGVRRPLPYQKRDVGFTREGPNGEIFPNLKRCWLHYVSRVSSRALELVNGLQKRLGYEDDLEVLSEYDVFLSFRGPDARQCLADVLYNDMVAAGLSVFRDNNELEVGDRIIKILPCIDKSKICVPILSKNFAASVWCLREVERMVELRKDIRPIFYNVTADDVKLKTELFKKDLRKHVKKHGREQVQKWEDALKAVGEIIGRQVRSTGLAEFSKSFIRPLVIKLTVKMKPVNDLLVARDEEEKLMKLLNIHGEDGRLVIGIHGMGGVGKTTLAKVVFNRLSAGFDCCSFLENIQESVRDKDLEYLQKQLLEDLNPKMKDFPVIDPIKVLKEKFTDKKVLIVLDDVSEKKQVEIITQKLDRFGSGSRIIITSRNAKAFTDGVHILELRGLKGDQALQLFSRHAFGKESPPSDRKSFADEVISLTGWLPLALEVIGSRLYGCDENIWKATIEKLEKIPDQDVHGKLKLSFDALNYEQKQVFLDIACFFVDMEKSRAMYMWEDCDLFPVVGIDVLISMSLLKITRNDEFWMHKLVRDLGREIVREEYPDELAKRSRIWSYTEAAEVLKIKKGKEKVKGLSLCKHYRGDMTDEELSSFNNLLLLKLVGTNLVGDLRNILLPQLRWLSWHECLPEFAATNLSLEKLVILDLSRSSIDESWAGWRLIERANNLKVLDLTDCRSLKRTPDLSSNEALERLILNGCSHLVELHTSIGKLKRLKHLDLTRCRTLKSLPDLSNNKALETLILSGCFSLIEIHSSIGQLKRLKHLDLTYCSSLESTSDLSNNEALEALILADCSNLVEMHNSVGKLKRLKCLDLTNCISLKRMLDLSNNEALERLILTGCSSLAEIDRSIGKLRWLKHLHAEESSLVEFPEEICSLENLEEILISSGWQPNPNGGQGNSTFHITESIGSLPSLSVIQLRLVIVTGIQYIGKLVNLTRLDLVGSIGIEVLPDTIGNMESLVHLDLSNTKLRALPETVGHLPKLESLCLQSTEVTELPDTIGDLGSLCRLDLSRTKLRALPVSIGQLDKLETLSLTASMIEELPYSFGDLTSLRELSMRRTNIKELPGTVGALKSLELLYLTETPLAMLPDTIGDLKSLRKLDLSETMVEELPDSLGDLSSLEHLDIRSSEVSKLPSTIGKLTKLESLYADGCKLTEIPTEIGNLSRLRSLCLSASYAAKVPPTINRLTSLRDLRIEFHPDEVHGSGPPAGLTASLDLGALSLVEDLAFDFSGSNRVVQLPPALTSLELIRVVPETKLPDFSDLKDLTMIKFIDCSLKDVSELESLQKLRSLRDVEVCNCTEEVVEFCRQLRNVKGMRRRRLVIYGPKKDFVERRRI